MTNAWSVTVTWTRSDASSGAMSALVVAPSEGAARNELVDRVLSRHPDVRLRESIAVPSPFDEAPRSTPSPDFFRRLGEIEVAMKLARKSLPTLEARRLRTPGGRLVDEVLGDALDKLEAVVGEAKVMR